MSASPMPRGRAGALLASFLFVIGTTVPIGVIAFACGANEGEGPTTPNKPRGSDTTEVTMERTAFDAAEGPGPSTTTTTTTTTSTPTTAASTPGHDPSDEPNIGGVQSDPAIEKAVVSIRPRLRACYKKALAIEPNVGGSATFDATIGAGGHVAGARFVKRDGLSEDMMGCITTAVKAMTFEVGKKSQVMTFTFGSPPKAPSTTGTTDAGKP